jgi:hypothetical protein
MLDSIESLKEKIGFSLQSAAKAALDRWLRPRHRSARRRTDSQHAAYATRQGRARDLIIIDMQGNKLEGSGEPNGENAMHTSIYKAVPMCSVFSTIIRTNWCRQARRIRELER